MGGTVHYFLNFSYVLKPLYFDDFVKINVFNTVSSMVL